MSVVKSKRSQSKVEFEMLYFKLADSIDNLVEHNFYAKDELLERNKVFLEIRYRTLEELTDTLLYHIKIANSIYPTCMTEWEERRVTIGKAIGTCYAILTHYQRIMMRLRIPDNKYVNDIVLVTRMINSLKAWRKSDNKLKASLLEKKQTIKEKSDEGNNSNVVNNNNLSNDDASDDYLPF